MQTDFTWAKGLGITIGGEPFPHMLCHPILPYSNWEWATICRSESLSALKRGVQEAVWRLGRVQEFTEKDVRVTTRSAISVKYNVYSVPSRLIGEMVQTRIYDDRIEVYYGGKHQLTTSRLLGRGSHRIDYRHIIWSLVRKPRAFRVYKYREDQFPSLGFRKIYDKLCEVHPTERADLECLRILHLAASTRESEVETALDLILEDGSFRSLDQVKALVDRSTPTGPPTIEPPKVDLDSYDRLLVGEVIS